MQQAWATGEVHTECWWGDRRDGGHLENLGIDGMIILKMIFKKYDVAWAGFILFGIRER